MFDIAVGIVSFLAGNLVVSSDTVPLIPLFQSYGICKTKHK